MTSQWVLNASPLILLGKAGELDWILRLGEVVVPLPVAVEIFAGDADDAARRWLSRQTATLTQPAPAGSPALIARHLGAGETAVLAWAAKNPDFEAVLDDAAARRAAKALNVKVRGTLSLVVLAKRRGFLPACAPVFERLRRAGLFLTEPLIAQALAAAGE